MTLPAALTSKEPAALVAHWTQVLGEFGWDSSVSLLQRVLRDVEDAFAGKRPGYRPIDMHYHDLGHTLQATVCMTDLIAGQQRQDVCGRFDQRTAELGVIAALLHDVGFLKHADDDAGTGAKYTMVHERRSCDFARVYLPGLGATSSEIELVCSAIGCTGPRNRISAQAFPHPAARRLACLLVTADYISQMSAPDYPDKLDALFAEFTEAFRAENVPVEKRPYHSADELRRKTPDFWEKLVRPMLDSEADGVHRFLSVTGHSNPYLHAIAANLEEIRRRTGLGLLTT